MNGNTAPFWQEVLALTIVALAALLLILRFFRKSVTAAISSWLLKRGHVKWAMRLRFQGRPRSPQRKGAPDSDCCA